MVTLPRDETGANGGGGGNGGTTEERSERGSLRPLRAQLPPRLWKVLWIIFLFSLGNASDAFLLLRLTDVGVAAVWIPIVWAALHVVKSSSSIYGGRLSDRFGRKRLIVSGWLWYAVIYAGFAYFDGAAALVALFVAYGVYFGLTEGAEKALVADLAPPQVQGTAFGIYNGLLGVGALASSLAFGWLWTSIGPEIAFAAGAGVAVAAAALITRVI